MLGGGSYPGSTTGLYPGVYGVYPMFAGVGNRAAPLILTHHPDKCIDVTEKIQISDFNINNNPISVITTIIIQYNPFRLSDMSAARF